MRILSNKKYKELLETEKNYSHLYSLLFFDKETPKKIIEYLIDVDLDKFKKLSEEYNPEYYKIDVDEAKKILENFIKNENPKYMSARILQSMCVILLEVNKKQEEI